MGSGQGVGQGVFFAVFLVAAFLAAVFLVAVFLVVDFFAGARLVVLRTVGPLARLSAMSSRARSAVNAAGSSPRGTVALTSPSVTYGPKRPSLSTIGLPLTGSSPNSASGAAAARVAPRPRVRG